MATDPRDFRFRGPVELICAICVDPFVPDDEHPIIRVPGPYPRLPDVLTAVEEHQHTREPEL